MQSWKVKGGKQRSRSHEPLSLGPFFPNRDLRIALEGWSGMAFL